MCFIPEIFNDNDGDCDICKKKGRIKWKVTCVMVKSNSVDRALHLQGRFCNTSLLWFWRLASLDFTLHPVSAYLPTLHEPDLGNLKSNWRELGEKEMMTTMRKPSWPQLRQQCYQARKFGAIFISRKTQKWAQMPPLPIHAQILSQNLTQRGKNEPNTYVCLAKSLTKEPSVFLLSLRNNS